METLTNTDARTMPTAERPLRLAEFDDLFATALQRVERRGSGVRTPSGEECLGDWVRDLTARERSCSSFFSIASCTPT